MARIPDHFIADLLRRVDVVALIGQYVSLKKRGTNYFGPCPFHQEKTASFSVSAEKAFFHCFGCGAHGNAIRFLMSYQGLTFVEAVQDLATREGLTLPQETVRSGPSPADLTPLYQLMEAVATHYAASLTADVRRYLAERGVGADAWTRFRLGYAEGHRLRTMFPQQESLLMAAGLLVQGDDGRYFERFRRRLMFPIEDQRGRVIAFGGRLMAPGEPKYLNSPETALFVKGEHLYGFSLARAAIAQQGDVFVVEGYMDVVSLVQAGIENTVAVLGTACSLKHLQYLGRYAGRIIFCFDGDTAGQHAAERVFHHVLSFIDDTHRVSFIFLPEGQDPDSVVRLSGRAGFDRLVHERLTAFSEFFFQLLLSQVGEQLAAPEGQSAFIHLLQSWLVLMPASALRFSLLQKAATFIQTDVDQLHRLIFGVALGRSSRRLSDHQSSDAQSLRSSAKQETSHPMTIERKLCLLLFFSPAAYERVPLVWTMDGGPDAQALRFLLSWCAAQTPVDLTTAYLSEALSDTPPWHQWLSLAWEGVLPYLSEEEWLAEFEGALMSLEKRYVAHACDTLAARAQVSALSQEEQGQLRDLLQRLSVLKRLSVD